MRISRWIVAVLLISTPVLAQFSRPASDEYVAATTADEVNIRTAPDLDEKVATRLDKGARLTVVGAIGQDFLIIKPVKGCFSVISKDFVEPSADGLIGTVTGDNVRVRAGGDLIQDRFLVVQRQLAKGDRVRILGSVEGWYKIEPPAGAYWYVSKEFVRRLTAQEAAQPPEQPIDNGGQQVVQPPVNNGGNTNTQTQRVTPPDPNDPARKAFNEAEEALTAEFKKPYDQRSFEPLLAKYKAIEVPEDHYLNAWIDVRVRFLEDVIRQRGELESHDTMLEKTAAEQQRLKEERTKLEMSAGVEPAASSYAAEGVLEPSALYPGRGGIPRRFMLRNPQTGGLVAFVQSTSGTVKLDNYSGKHVGVFGSRTFDAKLNTLLVDAMQVKVIDENPALPRAVKAQPIVPEPQPKQAPAPAEQQPGDGDQPIPSFEQPQSSDDGEAAETAAKGIPEAPAADPALNTVNEKEYK